MIMMHTGRPPQDAHLCHALMGEHVTDRDSWCKAIASHYVEVVDVRNGVREMTGARLCIRHAAAELLSAAHDFVTATPLKRPA